MEAVELAARMHVAPADVDAVVPVVGKYPREGVRLMPLGAGIADQAAVIAALSAVQTTPRPPLVDGISV